MPHGSDSPQPPFRCLPTCCAAAARQGPSPLFPKAVEWLDSSKPCWQSRVCFGRLFGPVAVHALAAVLPPCACISAVQIGVCVGVPVCIPRLSPAQVR